MQFNMVDRLIVCSFDSIPLAVQMRSNLAGVFPAFPISLLAISLYACSTFNIVLLPSSTVPFLVSFSRKMHRRALESLLNSSFSKKSSKANSVKISRACPCSFWALSLSVSHQTADNFFVTRQLLAQPCYTISRTNR